MKVSFKDIKISDLAGLICDVLAQHNIDAILVGGACVTIYSDSKYLSYDLDLITYEDKEKISHALNEIGFKKQGRY